MTQQPRFVEGDTVHVWLGRWVRARVIGWSHWSHPGGNTFVAYRVDIGAKTPLVCSGNSIREVIGRG